MEVSQQDLLKIVEQASTLTERLSKQFIPEESQTDEKLISSRLEAWCQASAQGDSEKFAKRLAWDGLDINTVVKVLGKVRLADAEQLPTWIETLRVALQILDINNSDVNRCLDPENPIPFEEVFLPFVQVARCRLITQVGEKWHLLSQAVQIELERQLLTKLKTLCAKSLQLEFLLFKALKQSPLTLLLGGMQGSNSDEQYQTFVKNLKTGELLSFFQKYSVLARLVATLIDFWVEEKAEFIQRLASDLPIIQQVFQEDTGEVVAIKLDLSDPHNRRRSVIALTFASGLKLMYKPRGLGLETVYFQLLAWCNQQKVLLPFKLVKVIDCKTHGWMEYVEHLPCEDKAAVGRYYQRAGMLVCLVYVLQGIDCHHENLIASGEHPVLVDVETLLDPRASDIDNNTEQQTAQFLVNQQFFDSVLRTGLLPNWAFGADGENPKDVSGLGGVGQENVRTSKWKNVNTDNMTLGYEFNIKPLQGNVVGSNGTTHLSSDYANEIVDGFCAMYQFLLKRREALLAQDSPILALADQRVRFIFRLSNVYAQVLCKAIQPDFLRHGVDRSIQLDVLSRAFLKADTKPLVWSLLRAELQASEQMDIPYYAVDSSSNALTVDPDINIDGYFKETAYDRMISLLKQLNEADLAQQIPIIRGSLYSQVASGMTNVLSTESASTSLDTTVPLASAQLVQEAIEIAKQLQQRAIHAADGSFTCVGMGYLPKSGRLQLQPLDSSLYGGVCGVGLFLAALAKITGEAEYRNLALSTLQNLTKSLQNPDLNFRLRMIKQIGIGGAAGVASIVYALVRVSQFLESPELLDTAKQAASLVNQDSIAGDRSFDIMAGAAGAILGLLSLYQVTLDPVVLEQVQALGYHLLMNRVKSDSGFRTWATLEGKLVTGFSHGAAGIAYALLRLYKTTQDPIFLEAAEEAIAYERSVFCPRVGNWSDVKEKPLFMTSWCHGAPGVGLARLGGLSILDTSEIRQEIAVALNTTQNFGLQNLDHVCCGNFGRIEVLLVAAQKLSDLKLQETAQKQAARIIARVKHTGSFYLFPELLGDIYNPGFFQGTAGIGYELLRLAFPESLPCVLLWE